MTELPEEVRAIFRGYTARRRRIDRPCAVCGQPMANVLLRQRYCSPTCRWRAYYERRTADVLAQQRAYRQRVKERQAQPPDPAASSE